MYRLLCYSAPLLCFLFVGCGKSNPPTYEVTGIVVFDDGKPLTNGSVEFETKEDGKPIVARGKLGPDGRFKLGTYESADGARPGEHRVAVFSNVEIGTGHERPDKIPPQVLDPLFSDVRRSGLKFTVKEDGTNDFRVEVKRIPKE